VTPAATQASTRARIVAAAVALTTSEGWAAVTMSRLADDAGVSRQTVYNEVGSKTGLAEAMVLTELDRFLSLVDDGFAAHPDDLGLALRDAVRGVLREARRNELLREIVSPGGGDLLPPLTTDAGALLDAARGVVSARVAAYDVAVCRHARAHGAQPCHAALGRTLADGRRRRRPRRAPPPLTPDAADPPGQGRAGPRSCSGRDARGGRPIRRGQTHRV